MKYLDCIKNGAGKRVVLLDTFLLVVVDSYKQSFTFYSTVLGEVMSFTLRVRNQMKALENMEQKKTL